MRNNEPTYREKGRAVFLAAIMVLSVVAMSVALSGAAAASASDNDIESFDDQELSGADNNEALIDVNSEAGNTLVVTSTQEDENGDEFQEVAGIESIDNSDTDQEISVEIADGASGDQTAWLFIGDAADGVEVGDDATGVAGAANDDESASVDASPIYSDDVVFQGEDVTAESPLIQEDETFNVREVSEFDSGVVDSSSQKEQIVADEDGEVEIDTDDFDAGDYFLRGGDLNSSPAQTDTFEVTIQDLAVEFDDDNVTDDGPDALTDYDIDSDRGTYSLNISAGGDLDDEELFDIFSGEDATFDNDAPDDRISGDADLTDLDANEFFTNGDWDIALYNDDEDDDDADADEKIVLANIEDSEETVNFTDIDPGNYDFNNNVTDADSNANASITVDEEDAEANFDQDVYTQSAGDVQEFEIELEDTDDAYLQFGDEDAGYIDILYLEDDDDSGYVNFTVNTRLIGTDHTAFNGSDNDLDANDVVYSDDDNVESLIHHGFVDPDDSGELDGFDNDQNYFFDDSDVEDGDAFADEGDVEDQFTAYLEELDLISEDGDSPLTQLVRPAQPTDYDLAVDNQGKFIADDDESELDDEIGFATLDLIEPELGDINTWVGPSEDADEYDDISELVDELTERDTVAIEDSLVIQAEASGMYGALSAFDADNGNDLGDGFDDGFEASVIDDLDEYEYEGISITVEDEDPIGNQDENALDFGSDDVDEDEIFVLVDNYNGELYIVVDTDASDAFSERDPADGDEFSVEIEYEVEDDRARFSDSDEFGPDVDADGDDDDAYPYLGAGDSLSASTSFTFEDAAVEWDNVDDDGNVELEIDDNATISGETNIAPGSDATQRVRHAGNTSSFLNNVDTEIHSDGTFEGTTDFSDREVDDEARMTFRLAGSTIDTGDGIFVEGVGVEDDDDDDDVDDVEMDDDADDDVEMDDDVEEPTDDDDEQPGFGVAVALVALLAAAMLALRRRD